MESTQEVLPLFRKLAPSLFLIGGFYLVQTILDIASKPKQKTTSQDLQRAVQKARATELLDRPSANPGEEPYAHLSHLAETLLDNYEENRSMETLEESIDLYRESLSQCPMTAAGRDDVLFYLAYALDERYRIRGSIADLEECIDLLQRSLDLRPIGHPYRDGSLTNLGKALADRYARHGGDDDLKKTIELYTESLELCPPGHPTRNYSLNNLGKALGDRYKRHGSEDDLKRRIELYTESLELCPPGHPSRDIYLDNLGNALSHRYARHGSEDDLKRMIELHTETLELRPPGHPTRDASLNNLGSALWDCYACHGNENDLKRSIELYTESLELRPLGHPTRDISLNNLGNALGDRYARHGSEDDLKKTIELYTESLAFCPPGHPSRDISLGNLGNALSHRYARHGSEHDLKRSIELYTEALELCPPDHPTRASFLNNLANALGKRYARHGSEDDITKSIKLLTESLELCPPGHPSRDIPLNNLGFALADRYARHASEDDLKKTIELYTESLQLCPPGHPSRNISLISLGTALRDRYVCNGSEDDLKKTIELYTESLELCPPGHPARDYSLNGLGKALSHRYSCHGSEDDLKKTVELLTESLELRPPGHPTRDISVSNLVDALADRYNCYGRDEDLIKAFELLEIEVNDINSTEVGMLRCALKWVALAEKLRHDSLGRAYVQAIGCLRRYLSVGPTAELQYKAILQQTQLASLSTNAAAYFIESGDLEQAVELLDEGRSLLWSEMRRFREPLSLTERETIVEPLSSRYNSVCKDIWDLSNMEVTYRDYSKPNPSGGAATSISYDVVLTKKREKIEEYNGLLDEIRCLPDCEDFQKPKRFERLQTSAKEGPVIIVNCSERRSDAIIVFADRMPSLVSLKPNFRSEMLKAHDKYLDGLAKMKGADGSFIDPKLAIFEFSLVLRDVAAVIWDSVVRLVVEKLEEAGVSKGSRIWWCPTSVLTSLPIHAAGKGSDFLVDHCIPSYTPTLGALIDSRRTVTNLKPSPPRILLVAQSKARGLDTADEEIRRMVRLGSLVEVLDGQEATPVSVIANLPTHDWVHLVCHGIISENPFESSLILHDRSQLSLNDIIKTHVPDAQFAFLAACHTAELNQGTVLQDEVLHLAAAMQFSGFRSVVGTMWQMADADGPRLAEVFYKEMLAEDGSAGEKHTRAARALWKAVQMMRRKIPMARWANFVHIGA